MLAVTHGDRIDNLFLFIGGIMADSAKRIGRTVRTLRVQRGMTQAQLAERVGISPAYMSLIERGKRNAELDILERIAAQFNLPLAILIFLSQDYSELEAVDKELAERLATLTMKLIEKQGLE